MLPWVGILALIVSAYVLLLAIKGLRDFYIWYREGREFAQVQAKMKALRRQKRADDQQRSVPSLKERPGK